MANPQEATQDIGPDPDLSFARLAAIGQTPPAPPPPEHPMIAFARNLLNPANYAQEPFDSGTYTPSMPSPTQPQMPAGFNPYAAPADQRGASTDPFATLGQASANIHNAVSNIPVLGGIANFAQEQVNRGPIGTGLGVNPAQAGLQQGTPEYRSAIGQSLAAGIIGPESEGSQIAGGLKNRIGAPSSVAGDIAAEGAGPLQTAAQKAAVSVVDGPLPDWLKANTTAFLKVADSSGLSPKIMALAQQGTLTAKQIAQELAPDFAKAGVDDANAVNVVRSVRDRAGIAPIGPTVGPGGGIVGGSSDLASRQVDALKAGGATDAQIADFQKTMAPPPEVPKPRTIQTAEGQAVDPGLLTRSLQTAAGQEGVPLSQHPDFAAYGKGGPKVGAKGAVGGDIGTATRAVMAGDPKAMSILGPDLTQQLIQNKIAQIVRQTGAPEDVIRRGLSVMNTADRVAAVPSQVATAGRNVQAVEGALSGLTPAQIAADEMANLRNKGYASGPLSDAEKARAAETGVTPPESAPVPESPAPASGGVPPPKGPGITTPSGDANIPLPYGPNRPTAASLAVGLAHVALDIPRAAMLIGHMPLLRQAPPLMANAILRGAPQDVANMLVNGLKSPFMSEASHDALTQQFKSMIEAAGLRTGADGVFIAGAHGPLTNLEEYGLRSILNRVPGLANINRIYPTMLNSLRTDAAVAMANQFKQSGRAIDSALIGRRVNIASGRGYLYPGDVGSSGEFQNALGGMFFGPRLASSSWQAGSETLLALKDTAKNLLTRQPINPADAFQLRTVAGYVGTGIGIMKLANAFGLNVVTDPNSHDWGRIVLPDGARVDLWGAYGPTARLIAQELEWGNATYLQGRPQKFGASNGLDILGNYLRGKLNPGVPAGVADVMAGSTMGGQPTTPQTLLDPSQYLPLVAQEAMKSGSPLETGLVEAGAGVINTPQHFIYDGLGTKSGDPNFQNDPILAEHTRLALADPAFSKSGPDLAAHSGTLGTGKNEIKLDPISLDKFMSELGTQRRTAIAAVMATDQYRNASIGQQEKMFTAARAEADNTAETNFLAKDVVSSTDPATIQKEAVGGFIAQGTARDKAYWVALLDRAGKLTPAVAAAIDDTKVTLPGEKTPITVAEYLKAAPLVHEYLSHVPFGTDTHPIGTPDDWTTVAQAHVAESTARDAYIRSGMNTTLAAAKAKQDTLKSLTSLIQKNLFLNGTQLENPARTLLARKNPTLGHFVSDPKAPNESDAQYQDFPTGAP